MARRAFAFWIKPSRIDRVDEALASNQLIIGWSEAEGLLDPTLDKRDFREIVHRTYHSGESTKRKAGRAAPHLWRFIRELSIGDLVLVPRPDVFYLARVATNSAVFVKGGKDEDATYRRDVEWLNGGDPFPRSVLSEPLRARLKSLQDTSTEISDFVDELEKLVSAEIAGSDWTPEEIEAVVRDYFDMLLHELRGEPYSKTEHRRALMGRIGRSKGSIEFKHQNISAVLQAIGKPWIVGYKPRRNFQNALVDTVERFAANDFEDVETEPAAAAKIDPGVFVAPPKLKSEEGVRSENVKRLARKIDQADRDRRNRALGAAGEEFVVQVERKRLASNPDLAKRVRWESKERGDGLGYDVLSFEEDGCERFIEVKTTRGGIETPFYISSAEIAAAKELGAAYRLYRVFGFGNAPRIYEIAAPLEDTLALRPSVFAALPKA